MYPLLLFPQRAQISWADSKPAQTYSRRTFLFLGREGLKETSRILQLLSRASGEMKFKVSKTAENLSEF